MSLVKTYSTVPGSFLISRAVCILRISDTVELDVFKTLKTCEISFECATHWRYIATRHNIIDPPDR